MTTTASSTEPGTTRIATSADGTPIAYEVTGSGPALVLVDGAGVYDAVPQPTLVVAGGKSQTIVVALYADAYAAGARPPQAVDALAVIYFLIALVSLIIALRFVSPTQMVFKVK